MLGIFLLERKIKLEKLTIENGPILVNLLKVISIKTLVELDIEYKHLAHKNEAKLYYRVQTVSEDDIFIERLENIVMKEADEMQPCLQKFSHCLQKRQ